MRGELRRILQDCKSNPNGAVGAALTVIWIAAACVPSGLYIKNSLEDQGSLSLGEILQDLD